MELQEQEPLLTADEVAALLRVPRTTVYRLARQGSLPVVRVSSRGIRFLRHDVDRWITRRRTSQPMGSRS
jgi:excisionase family DNA binding protein